MIPIKKKTSEVFVLVLLSLCLFIIGKSNADDQLIRDFCRQKVGIFPHPNPSLCFKFVSCQVINGVESECESGKIFIENEGCVDGNQDTCQRFQMTFPPTISLTPTPPTPPTPTTVLPPTPTPSLPPLNQDLAEFCRAMFTGMFPNPNNCLSFVFCLNGDLLGIANCPSERPVVNTDTMQCVPGNPQTCEIFGQPTTTTTSTTTTTTTNTLPTLPTTTTTISVEIPTTTSTTQQQTTTSTWPIDVPTTLPTTTIPTTITFPTTTTPGVPSTSTVQPPPPPRDICRGNNFRFVADPTACYRYYFCMFGLPVPGECDVDRIFDSFFQGCVRGNRETCQRDRIINVTVVS